MKRMDLLAISATAALLLVSTGPGGSARADLPVVEMEMVFQNMTGSSQSLFYNPPARYRSVGAGQTERQTVEIEAPGHDRHTGYLLDGAHGGAFVPFGSCTFNTSYKTGQKGSAFTACTASVYQGGSGCKARATVLSPKQCRIELRVQ